MSETANQNIQSALNLGGLTENQRDLIIKGLISPNKTLTDLLPQLPQHPRLSSPKKAQKGSVPKEDRVSHPSHYTWLKDKCGIEVIDITRHLNFNIGNVIKYVLRSGHKQEEGMTNKEKQIEDLQKAIFYLNDEIKKLKTK